MEMRKIQSTANEKRDLSYTNCNPPIDGKVGVPYREIKRKPLSH